MAIRRRLVARAPDAFAPDLTRSLSVQADQLEKLNRTEEAIPCDEEALRTLRPHVLRLPQAHAELTRAIADRYRSRCEALGRELDFELLAALVEILERLEAGDREPEGRAARARPFRPHARPPFT